MSVQKIRRAIARFQGVELALAAARYRDVAREEKWHEAKTIEMWLHDLEFWRRVAYEMAKAQVTPKPVEQEWKGFVNYVLSEEDKERYGSWEFDDHDLWLLVAGHQQCGYKLSVSFNQKNDTFNATYVCNDATSPNKGYCLSAFAPDWYNAVKVLAFKHEIILDSNWVGKESKPKNNWG